MPPPHQSSYENKNKTEPPFQGGAESLRCGGYERLLFLSERAWHGCNDDELESKRKEGDIFEDVYTQRQGSLAVLGRVLSRTSAVDSHPGPPPDGGFWAWASGKFFYKQG